MSDGTATRRRALTKTHKRILGATGSIVVVVLVFAFVLPKIADYRSVLDVVRDLDWQDWALLAGAVVLNLSTFPPPWMAALPGLGYRDAMALTQASTALSIVSPAGAAVGMAPRTRCCGHGSSRRAQSRWQSRSRGSGTSSRISPSPSLRSRS